MVKIEETPTLWYTTHSMDRYQAQAQAWEGKVNIALKLLEFENALGLAGKTAEEIGDGPRPNWRAAVRKIVREIAAEWRRRFMRVSVIRNKLPPRR